MYVYWNASKMHITMETAQPLKWLLKTLFLTIKKCTGFATDVMRVNTKVCSVTSKPTQGSSRCVSSLEDSSVLYVYVYI